MLRVVSRDDNDFAAVFTFQDPELLTTSRQVCRLERLRVEDATELSPHHNIMCLARDDEDGGQAKQHQDQKELRRRSIID